MHRGDVHLSSTRERTTKATAKCADDRDDGQRGEDRAEGLRATHQEPDTPRRTCATRQCQARSGLLQPRVRRAEADAPAALEHVAAAGLSSRPRQDAFIAPLDESSPMLPEMHHPNFVLKLHRSCVPATPP